MFIKFNEGTVRRMEEWERDMKVSKRKRKCQQTAVPPGGREMDEDDEEDVDIPSIAALFRRPERKEAAEVEDEKEEKQLPSPSPAVVPVAVLSVPDPPASDEVERFIQDYVGKHGIHDKYRWRDYNLQQLESAGAEWKPQPMRDTAVVLKRKMMAWVRAQPEQEVDADVVDTE